MNSKRGFWKEELMDWGVWKEHLSSLSRTLHYLWFEKCQSFKFQVEEQREGSEKVHRLF